MSTGNSGQASFYPLLLQMIDGDNLMVPLQLGVCRLGMRALRYAMQGSAMPRRGVRGINLEVCVCQPRA